MLKSRVRAAVISIAAALLTAASWILNTGKLKAILLFFGVPYIHGALFVMINLLVAKYMDKCKKMRYLNGMFLFTYISTNLILPEVPFFGLINANMHTNLFARISLAIFVIHIVLLIWQPSLAFKARQSYALSIEVLSTHTNSEMKVCVSCTDCGFEIPTEFKKLMTLAIRKSGENWSVGSQVIAMETSSGAFLTKSQIIDCANESCLCCSDLLKELEFCGSEVVRIVVIWQGGVIDIPSYSLRKSLVCLNPKNAEAKILLNCGNKYIVKLLKDTI